MTYIKKIAYCLGVIFLCFNLAEAKTLKNQTAKASCAILNTTAQEAKQIALRRARALLIEQANGVSIVSSTLVKDGKLAMDFIKSYSNGYILNEKIEWLPITQYQKDLSTPPIPEYNVKITADVKIVEKVSDLVLSTSLNKKIFRDKEKMFINLKSSKNAKVMIFYLGIDDMLYKITPMSKNDILYLDAQKQSVYPKLEEDSLIAQILPNKQNITEALWIIATDKNSNIDFYTLFSKDKYSLNEFHKLYSKIAQKCVEEVLPYQIIQ